MCVTDNLLQAGRAAAARAVAALCVIWMAGTVQAQEAPRIALVVGNEAYQAVTALDNAVSDARLVAASLVAKGFDVTLVTDADQVSLNRAIAQFGRDLRSGGDETIGLFFYAGHAVQSFGANYLLPVDVALTDAADLSLVAVRADAILRQMASAANRANVVILDACRNNPFVDIPDMNDNGLAEMKAPTGTFMAYSTAPGSVALDGLGGNSPFTAALVAEMDTPGLTIEQAFKRVRSSVLEQTGGRQTPWDTSSLTTDVYFSPPVEKSPEELAADRFFESIRQTRDPVQIVLFLRTYPDSEHFEAARTLLAEVLDGAPSGAGTAAAPVPSAPAPAPTSQAAAPAGSTLAAPAPSPPAVDEQDLIAAARISGKVEDYEAYLEAFPNGVFAELARMEIAAKVAKDPAAPPGGLAEATAAAAPAVRPAPAPDSDAPPPMTDLTLETVLDLGDPALAGQTIAALIQGTPLFPPIEGLPEPVWKDRSCATCHDWTPEALCTQAQTYLAESGTRALGKDHPYGGGFKRVLRDWAGSGCN